MSNEEQILKECRMEPCCDYYVGYEEEPHYIFSKTDLNELKSEALQELKEKVEGIYGDAMAPPQSAEAGYNKALDEVFTLIDEAINE